MNHDLQRLEERLARAERRLRLVLCLLPATLLAGFALALSQSAPGAPATAGVRAPFQVTDASGHVLFEVSGNSSGAIVRALSASGTGVVETDFSPDEYARVSLRCRGKPALMLGAGRNGGGALFLDGKGEIGAELA